MSTLRELGEREAIRRLARLLGASRARVGLGDDAAVVPVEAGYDWLLTTDPVIEGTHFRPGTPWSAVGHKAVGRVLSDLAAMGGEPLWILLDVVAPGTLSWAALEEMYEAARDLAARHGAELVGGDMAEGPVVELHAFGVGRVPEGTAVRRCGARPGDALYVTGRLGGSFAGRHLTFQPRVAEGHWLREGGWVSAMIDVSDGLAADARHLAESSGVGFEIEADRVPVSEAASATGNAREALSHALGDGEDFELLFTVPAGREGALERAWADAFRLPCTRIGRATASCEGIVLRFGDGRREALEERGFEHFVG